MVVELTWHLILMVVVTIVFFLWIAAWLKDEDGWGFLVAAPLFLLLCVIWAIYGGIVWW